MEIQSLKTTKRPQWFRAPPSIAELNDTRQVVFNKWAYWFHDRMWRAVFPLLKTDTRASGACERARPQRWPFGPSIRFILLSWARDLPVFRPHDKPLLCFWSRKTISSDIIDVTDVPVIKLLACEGPRCQRAPDELRERSLRACRLRSGGDSGILPPPPSSM